MSARPSQSAHSKDNTFPLLRKIIADYKKISPPQADNRQPICGNGEIYLVISNSNEI